MVLNSFSLHVGDKGFKAKKKEHHGPREENNFFTSKSKRICRLNKKNDHSFFSFQHLNILVVLALVIKVPMVIYSFFLQLCTIFDLWWSSDELSPVVANGHMT